MGTRRVETGAALARTAKPARPRRATARALGPQSCDPSRSKRTRSRETPKPSRSQSWNPANAPAATAGAALNPGAGKGRRGWDPRERRKTPGQTRNRVWRGPDLEGAHGQPQERRARPPKPKRLGRAKNPRPPAPSRAAQSASPGARGLLGTPGWPGTQETARRGRRLSRRAPSREEPRPPGLGASRSERRWGRCKWRQVRANLGLEGETGPGTQRRWPPSWRSAGSARNPRQAPLPRPPLRLPAAPALKSGCGAWRAPWVCCGGFGCGCGGPRARAGGRGRGRPGGGAAGRDRGAVSRCAWRA